MTPKKIHRCQFCNSQIDPADPFFEQQALKLTRKELEEIRKFMAFCLNKYGMFSDKDAPTEYVNSTVLLTAYYTLTNFLMK